MILISIVLPTYNGSKWIKASIDSVLSQSFNDWELLVIDDDSADNTDQIVKEYCSKDNRIKYYKNETNLGLQKTLNKGLKYALGKYIARLDDDDVWLDTEKLQKQYDFLEQHPDNALIGTSAIILNEDGSQKYRLSKPTEDSGIRATILKYNNFIHSSVLFRKRAVLAMGGYSIDNQYKHCEDYELWLRMGLRYKFTNLPDYAVGYRVRANAISSTNRIKQYKTNLLIIKKYRYAYPHFMEYYIYNWIKFLVFGFINRDTAEKLKQLFNAHSIFCN